MKLKPGFIIIAACLFAGGFSSAKTTVDDGVVRDIYGLESLFVNQHQYVYLPISPPMDDVLWQPFHNMAVPVDWKKFPAAFTKQLFAEMKELNGDLYPVYAISIYEDPVTRETVFCGLYGEIYRLGAEDGYDPFLWAKTTRQIDDISILSEWERWLCDPAKIAATFKLIPEVFHDDYLAAREEQAALEAAMVPMGMAMMSLPATVTNLLMAIESTTNGVVLELGWPEGFFNQLEIYSTENLPSNCWSLASGKLSTIGNTNLLWAVPSSTNSRCFFRMGDATTDTDGDFLPDARELVVTRSLIDDPDSDDGTIPDGYEYAFGMNPNDSADDAAVIAAYQSVAGDPDGDLSPDWRETLQGTNPHDRFD